MLFTALYIIYISIKFFELCSLMFFSCTGHDGQQFGGFSPDLSSIHASSSSFCLPESSSFCSDWISSLGLTLGEKQILNDGSCLTASHVAAANKLLKKAFPRQNGLEDTHCLLEKSQWNSHPDKFVQIIYVDSGHWVCVSNKFSPDSCIDLFDSMHTSPEVDDCIIKQVCRIVQSSRPSITINTVNVQQQVGITDCCLFAVAMAYDLCRGIDPVTVAYCQPKMRRHMEFCFEQESLMEFPSSTRIYQRRLVNSLSVALYCVCRQPEHTPMACCDHCNVWFHASCVDIPEDIFEDDSDQITWICDSCELYTLF